jgi:hypothetical protein
MMTQVGKPLALGELSRIKNEPKRSLQLELGISKSLAAMGLAHYSTNARSLPTILFLLLMVIDLKRL